ncbi:hypothetical protein GY45DRAFT_1257833 [Cubamyces sp. BRFM 1775]|nr:hypothetical protein GY45DRAFT_1257833 [Cubamyces sp. BRFM 1775]
MSFRRVNRSKKVPGVKLRPAAPSASKDLRTPESTWTHSSGLDSDEEATHADLCPRPFKGLVLCATGINDKTSMFKLALELGAQTMSDLTDKVTHLIAAEPGSAKYRCALANRIPIMHPSWITESHKVWLRGDDVDVEESIRQYRLPPFAGVVLCVSGIEDVNRRMEINREVTKGGGMYVKQIERPVRVTHLLCANTSDGESEKVRYAEKFNRMGEANIHIVWEDWFWDSLRFGGRFDEEAYKVSNPRPLPKQLPEQLPPESSTTSDQPGISSEIQNVQASAADAGDPPPPPAAGPSSHSHEDDEEIASVKRVPAATLRLWQSILKPRGFEVQDGRLVRSPSKSQSRQDTSYRREPSPSSRALRRGSLKAGDGEPNAPASAISSFRRARSFAPAAKDVSTPLSRQPFKRAPTITEGAMVGRNSSMSFLGRSIGSLQGAGGISSDIPFASTSAMAGPSTSREGSAVPDGIAIGSAGAGVSQGARALFKGKRLRALGEARCANVRRAVEECGGSWIGVDDDDDSADYIVVRLVSGSAIFRQEGDETERAKYRTECWLERCIFEERICAPEEHIAFVPLAVEAPIPGSEHMVISYSGLEQSEACWIRRLLRALGIAHAPNFSRRTTHLLCPSGQGAKAEKAHEWGTPIVDMDWLAQVARMGEIPPTAAYAGDSAVQDGDNMNLQIVDYTGEREVLMATQQPAKAPDRNGKGKEKSQDGGIVDITNVEELAPCAQSLSYLDPPAAGDRPEMEENESFGVPEMLLGKAAPIEPPDAPHNQSRAPTPLQQRESPAAPRCTQPTDAVVDASSNASIPTRLYDKRVPSSESPSPMRMPGIRSPTTPAKVAKHATTVLHESVTTSLGKRPAAALAKEREPDEDARRLRDAPLGKRARPLNRSRSNLSVASLTPGRLTPAMSPVPGVNSRAASVTPAFHAVYEPDLVPQLDEPGAQARSAPSGDEADNSFIAADIPDSSHVTYADPKQHGAREQLKHLFDAQGGTRSPREPWNVDAESNSMDGMSIDVDEMTLPQLPDVGVSAARRPAGRGRRGRARKGART